MFSAKINRNLGILNYCQTNYCRDVFQTQSNIWDGAFCKKKLMASGSIWVTNEPLNYFVFLWQILYLKGFNVQSSKKRKPRFHSVSLCSYPAGIHLLRVNNEKTRAMCEICLKLTIKAPQQRLPYPLKTTENLWFSDVFRGYRRRRSGVFIVNFEQISHIVLVFPLLSLNK